VNAESAARPEQEFRDALEINEIARRLWMVLRQNRRREVRDVAVRLFQADPDRNGAACGPGLRAKGAVRQDCWPKTGIQNRRHSRRYQSKPIIVVHFAEVL